MVRGGPPPRGQTLGHEITGEVAEVGRDVEFIKVGDLVSVPFSIACGRCATARSTNTGVCENVNPARAGAAYGYLGHGRLAGQPGRVRDRALCRLEPAQVPRPRPGHGQDP